MDNLFIAEIQACFRLTRNKIPSLFGYALHCSNQIIFLLFVEMDDEDCERRRMECLDEMSNLEKQFTDLKDQ